MFDREDALAIVDKAYAARVRGDKAALAECWAQDAHFEIAGDSSLMAGMALTAPRPMDVIATLMDTFRFSDLKRLDAVVEGRHLAVRWQLTITVACKPPVVTQLYDLIEIDDAGKIASLVQFADTALVRQLAT